MQLSSNEYESWLEEWSDTSSKKLKELLSIAWYKSSLIARRIPQCIVKSLVRLWFGKRSCNLRVQANDKKYESQFESKGETMISSCKFIWRFYFFNGTFSGG